MSTPVAGLGLVFMSMYTASGHTPSASVSPDAPVCAPLMAGVALTPTTKPADKNLAFKPGGLEVPATVSPLPDLEAVAAEAMAKLPMPKGDYQCQSEAEQRRVSLEGGEDILLAKKYLYRRLVHRLPAYGPGTSVVIEVGSDGKLSSTSVDWATWGRDPQQVRLESLPKAGMVLDAAALAGLQGDPTPVPAQEHGLRWVVVGPRYLALDDPDQGAQAVPVLLCSRQRASQAGAWNTVGLTFVQIGNQHLSLKEKP